ncbi:MAG TPA: hypothetical protein ENK57_11415 [Polyangiaceae bacterium]|nr:hypothetical protein [Polyangiaceae bacterium]
MAGADTDDTLEATHVEPGASRPPPASPQVVGEGQTVREGSGVNRYEPTEPLPASEAVASTSPRPIDLTPEDDEEPPLPVGTEVDHYRIMRLLGRGGMGEVYLARDTKLGRKVALKIVLGDVLRDQGEKERFLFEARATAALNHEHIVTIYGTGEYVEDGVSRPYVALEYLEGQNLRERLLERALSLPETLRVGRAIAEALAHAHDNGILHRDLKPANVVIANDGRLRVVDFGLAKVLTDDAVEEEAPSFIPGLSKMQESGENTWTAGTPSYMAPEQWRGESGGAATDVWALGVILFELCMGHKPFSGDNTAVLAAAVCSKDPAPPVVGDVPRELAQLVDRCLSKTIANRPKTREVVEVLDTLLEGTAQPELDSEPFRGLLPLGEANAASFHGRETEIAAFVERLRLQPMIPVVGPSGAGKSSFVRAGVFPRLREQQDWVILDVRPQGRPFRALAAALVVHGGGDVDAIEAELEREPAALATRLRDIAQRDRVEVLLFVDQLEELFTLAPPATARRFMQALYLSADDITEPIRVTFTLRQDFLDRVATEPHLSAALGQLVVIQRPGRDALERIVRRPIEARGYRFEDPAMVGEMVDAVADSPACLPLLSFAGRRLWEQRDEDDKLILRRAYDAMGGVAGALAAHADGVVGGLSRKERKVARDLLLRLVTTERTRRVVPMSTALEGLGERGRHVLDRLTEARLVSLLEGDDEETALELAHESLIVTWHTLVRWLDEGRDDRAFLDEVSQAAELWQKRGRRPEELWQGTALAEALGTSSRLAAVPAAVTEFLERGKQHQRRRKVRRRVAVGIAFVALTLVAIVLALQKREADRQRALAEAREEQSEQRRAQALREGARAAMGEGRWLEARAKLRSALEIEDAPAARALWWQLLRQPLRWRAPLATTAYAVAYAADGKTVAAACQDGAVYLIDPVERRTRWLRGHDDQVFSVAFAPAGNGVASGSFGGELRLWDAKQGKTRHTLPAHEATIWSLAYSPDGTLVATASGDRTVGLWDAQTGERRGTLGGHGSDVFGVAFSPDGRQMATGSFDQKVRLFPRPSGEPRVLEGHGGRVFSVAYSPDGTLVASASRDGTARLWNSADGALVREVKDDSGLFGVAFSPDGETLATSAVSGAIRLWDVGTGERRATLGKHDAVALGVAFSPDGRWVVSGGDDRSIRLWDASLRPDDVGLGPHREGVNRVNVDPKGEVIVTAAHDDTLRLWRLREGVPFKLLEGHGDTVRAAEFSPDGKRIASVGHDRDVRIWDWEAGTVERVLAGHQEAVFSVAFSPDGERLVTGARDRTVRLWDLRRGMSTHILEGHEADVRDVAFSPDGRLVASAGGDHTVRLWDARTGVEREVLAYHEGAVEGVSFSPDGAWLASGARDKTTRLYDVKKKTTRLLGEHEGRVYWLRFDPSGRWVAAPDSTGQIHLWEVGGDAAHRVIRGHRNEVNSVDFTPDGRVLVSGSDDGTVRTWDVASGRAVWRAPVLAGQPPRMLSHLGWTAMDGGEASPPEGWSKALVTAVEERADQVVVGEVICLRAGGELELWTPSADEPAAKETVAGLSSVVRAGAGCAALGSEGVWRASGKQLVPVDVARASAIGSGHGDEAFLVATPDAVIAFGPKGERLGERPAGSGIVALVGDESGVVVGYRDGHVERLGDAEALPFEETPNAVPTILTPGPGGVIFVGYGDGTVAMWQGKGGARLARARLHGGILHLLLHQRRLLVASDLGQSLVWDLDAFHRERCELLNSVWSQVPVVWEEGRALARGLPERHPCRQ